MQKNFQLGLKTKILSVLLLSLLTSIGIYAYIAIGLFKADKIAYISDSGTSKVDVLSNDVKNFLKTNLASAVNALKLAESTRINEKSIMENYSSIMDLYHIDLDGRVIRRLYNKPVEISMAKSLEQIKRLDKRIALLPLAIGPDQYLKIILEREESKGYVIVVLKPDEIYKKFLDDNIYQNFLIHRETEELFFSDSLFPLNVQDIVNSLKISDAQSKSIKGKDQSYITAFKEVDKAFGLIVVSLISEKVAYRAVEDMRSKSIWVAILIASISIGVAIIFAATIINPLKLLIQGTRRVSEGDFTKKVHIETGDELKVLGDSFNTMQEKINYLLEETKEKARMEGEIQVAQTVQNTLFPNKDLVDDKFKLHAHYQSASECGGDWWSCYFANNKLFYLIADATGHGVGPALITSGLASATSMMYQDFKSVTPNHYLNQMSRIVQELSKKNIFVTAFCAVFDFETMKLSFSNAGHNPPYIYRDGKWQTFGNEPKTRLGQDLNVQYNLEEMDFKKEDLFFFFTDGVSERESDKGNMLGEKRMLRRVNKIFDETHSYQETRDKFADYLVKYSSKEFDDDVTFAILKT